MLSEIRLPVCLFLLLIPLIVGCGIHSSNLVKEYNDFAVKCARMGLWDEAIMRWKRIVEMDPDNAKVHNNLAVAYESKGKLEAALAEYKIAIELDPDNKIYTSNYIRFKRNHERVGKKNEVQESRVKNQVYESMGQ